MFRKKIVFFALVGLVLLMISACGPRTGELYPNHPPVIYISSFGGVDSLSALEDSTIFQQTIYWEANDEDGVVEAFSYRVLDENGNPISTPDNEYIDEDGWVLHYEAGANESIPLNDPTAQSTIWTDAVYAVINFPANGEPALDNSGNPLLDPETGNPIYLPVISRFEIRCIDDRGDMSDTVTKYFKSTSVTPSVLVNSTQGSINEKTIGTGVILDFLISDKDPLIGDEPNYFLFKLEKIRISDGHVYAPEEGGYDDVWYDTRDINNITGDISKYTLTPNTTPSLLVNETMNDSTFADSTYLTAIAYDLAGIASEPKTIVFSVKDGFHPGTIIYDGYDPSNGIKPSKFFNDIFAIGDYHYSTIKSQVDDTIPISNLPEVITPGGTHYGLPFWIDLEGNFTAVYSENLKVSLHWGYMGEYGKPATQSGGDPTVTNSVHGDTRLGIVQDEDLAEPYFTELQAFDLQFDGEAYHYPPLAGIVYTYTDSLGSWTRIPLGEDIDQSTLLYNLDPGEHCFKVRAVDLSGVGDPTPAEFKFKLIEPVLAEDKEGILIIDDEIDSSFSPDAEMDSLYSQMLMGYPGEVVQIDMEESSPVETTSGLATLSHLLHFEKDFLAYTDIQKYKLIVYHSEKQNTKSNFVNNNNVFNLYFQTGGNLVTVLGQSVQKDFEYCNDNDYPLFETYFGIPRQSYDQNDSLVVQTSGTLTSNPYLIGANPIDGMTADINLEIEDSFVPIIGMLYYGIGMNCYFRDDMIMAEPIYTYKCKPDTSSHFPPSIDDYNLYNNKTIAVKYSTPLNTNYMFGFPLSFMKPEGTQQMFNDIFNELGM